MAYRVNFTLPERPLQRADAIFRVKRNRSLLGTLAVSQGALVWRPRNARRGIYVRWADFDRMVTGG